MAFWASRVVGYSEGWHARPCATGRFSLSAKKGSAKRDGKRREGSEEKIGNDKKCDPVSGGHFGDLVSESGGHFASLFFTGCVSADLADPVIRHRADHNSTKLFLISCTTMSVQSQEFDSW